MKAKLNQIQNAFISIGVQTYIFKQIKIANVLSDLYIKSLNLTH